MIMGDEVVWTYHERCYEAVPGLKNTKWSFGMPNIGVEDRTESTKYKWRALQLSNVVCSTERKMNT